VPAKPARPFVGIASDADELEELWGDVPAVEIEAAATA
jgi:hypothetical protein